MGAYFIKEGYEARPQPAYFKDEREVNFQPLVYPAAAGIARELGCRRIIDIGCGHAIKLVKLHPEFEIVGVDYGSNIQYCRRNHPFGTWVEWDIEREPLPDLPARGSVVVCADVIEHLIDPLIVLGHLRTLLEDAAAALVSTPERDLIRGKDHLGPPPNPCHVREWNMEEFRMLLVSAGLNPLRMELTQTADHKPFENTILATVPGTTATA